MKLPQLLNIGKTYRLTIRKKTMKLISFKTMYHVSSLFVCFCQISLNPSWLIKLIVQLLEDEPFEAFKPTVESLIADKDQNKQRAAAEFLAGVLGGNVFPLSYLLRNLLSFPKVQNIGQLTNRMHYGHGSLLTYRLYYVKTLKQIL